MGQRDRAWLLPLLTVYCVVHTGAALTREYYIGIREVIWDYAPSGKNLINGKPVQEDEHASVYLQQGPHAIGRKYKKAVYKQYTDNRYTQEVPKPAWLGYLGPIIRAEVDDVIIVYLKNFASRGYTIHTHGIFYLKDSEGALYPDGTSGNLKSDDFVPPGGNHTYRWLVMPAFAPTEGDANCLTWIYHSHVDSSRDIPSGVIGPLVTCKKGTLYTTPGGHNNQVKRRDVDQDFFFMYHVVDENLSWYLEENIHLFCTDPTGVKEDDDAFRESNRMHSINTYVYGNMPVIEMCVNRTVSLHLFGIGNEVDVHSAHFHGHTLLLQGHRRDVVNLFPAIFVAAEMVPTTVGQWMVSCQNNKHVEDGMQAFYKVSSCGAVQSKAPPGGKVRQYYIAAEEFLWNYAPLGKDTFENLSVMSPNSLSEVFFGKSSGKLGGVYGKVCYVEYTDSTFKTKKERTGSERHLGFLGPVIRGEQDDLIVVTFRNNAQQPYSIQSHGLKYEKRYEGEAYEQGAQKPSAHVPPGMTFTYQWRVAEGPSPSDPDCISYLYYSAADPVRDTSSGLMGPLLLCKKGALDESGAQKNVDKEFFLLFTVTDENLSWYLEKNIHMFGSNKSNPEDPDFQESNMMHAVNGFMYGNLPGLDLCKGDRVSWHTFGLGSEVDIHGIYFQGNTFRRDNTTRDTLNLFPHTSVTVFMEPDNEGTFEISCRTADHFLGGMKAQYRVKRCTFQQRKTTCSPPALVRYYIAAEEVVWDYSPSRVWELEKANTTAENSPGEIYVSPGPRRIGPKYKKVVYREYTDATFMTKKLRSAEEQHLDILGPIIRAEVGERVVVNFKNKATLPFSVHATGVVTSQSYRLPVKPGQARQYHWDIPEKSGPSSTDPNCISFAYYSAVHFVKDTLSGLFGPMVVCRKGTLDKNRKRRDVDREFALLFMIFDETQSWYIDNNIKTYLKADPRTFHMDDDFHESNKKHSMNGRLYGNLLGLTMVEGERVAWYLHGMGNEVDIHTVHFHAQSFIYKTDRAHRSDVYDLFPGTSETVEMIADIPGEWLLHCHVSDHIQAGMETTILVTEKGGDRGVKSRSTTLNAASPLCPEGLWSATTLGFLTLLRLLASAVS